MARSFLIVTVFFWALVSPIFPQNAEPAGPDRSRVSADQSGNEQDLAGSPPTVRVATVEFASDMPLPAKAEARLTRYITRRAIYDSSDWIEELEQRVKDAWQQYGYFQPEIQTSVRKLGQYTVEHNFALTFHVTAGRQYRLGNLRIKGGRIFPPEVLRDCIELQEGDIFDTHRIRAGMECLRSVYDANGYINFAVVPSTQIDDTHKRVSLFLDIEDGPQFRIGKIEVLGRNRASFEKLLQESGLKNGVIYSSQLVEDFFLRNRASLSEDVRDGADCERRIDESNYTVHLIFRFPGDEP
jgi:hypothetical protein